MVKEKRFNLITEPWICTIDFDGHIHKEGLQETFLHLQDRIGFCGEIRLQDTAMLRLFVAASVTMIYRMTLDRFGCSQDELKKEQLLNVYKDIWQKGCFPEDVVCHYFKTWNDRFWLIGGEYPFYQVPESKLRFRSQGKEIEVFLLGTDGEEKKMSHKNASAIVGTLSESNNKAAVFADAHGDGKKRLAFDEAARWLVWYMSYGDCSTKTPGKWQSKPTFASMGTNIYPIGKNLFETVMLNCVLLEDVKRVYPYVTPAWEKEQSFLVQDNPYGETFPRNIPELFTQQSRRIYLVYDDKNAIDIYIAAGDEYGTNNAFIEPMFLWRVDAKDKSGMLQKPISITAISKWKNVQNVLLNIESSRAVKWIHLLEDQNIIGDWNVPFLMSGIQYGDVYRSTINSFLSDSISVNSSFFRDDRKTREMHVIIDIINNLSRQFYLLGKNLSKAENADEGHSKIRANAIQFMFQDVAENLFAQYLNGNIENRVLFKKIEKQGLAIVEKEMEKEDISGFMTFSDEAMTAVKAENIFRSEFFKILPREEG